MNLQKKAVQKETVKAILDDSGNTAGDNEEKEQSENKYPMKIKIHR